MFSKQISDSEDCLRISFHTNTRDGRDIRVNMVRVTHRKSIRISSDLIAIYENFNSILIIVFEQKIVNKYPKSKTIDKRLK